LVSATFFFGHDMAVGVRSWLSRPRPTGRDDIKVTVAIHVDRVLLRSGQFARKPDLMNSS
jgi:hypothetical protein